MKRYCINSGIIVANLVISPAEGLAYSIGVGSRSAHTMNCLGNSRAVGVDASVPAGHMCGMVLNGNILANLPDEFK